MSATTSTVTLINAFEVPPEGDGPFIAGWERARDFLATRPFSVGEAGFMDGLSHTALHQALRTDAASLRQRRACRLAGDLAAGHQRSRVPGRQDAVRGASRPV
jgi:hypothetical protein